MKSIFYVLVTDPFMSPDLQVDRGAVEFVMRLSNAILVTGGNLVYYALCLPAYTG